MAGAAFGIPVDIFVLCVLLKFWACNILSVVVTVGFGCLGVELVVRSVRNLESAMAKVDMSEEG